MAFFLDQECNYYTKNVITAAHPAYLRYSLNKQLRAVCSLYFLLALSQAPPVGGKGWGERRERERVSSPANKIDLAAPE